MAAETLTFVTLNDAVLDDARFTLTDGFTLFFGVNGAGKSRILRGISHALTGVASDVQMGLVIRIDTDQAWSYSTAATRHIKAHGRSPIQAIAARLSQDEFSAGFSTSEGNGFDSWIPHGNSGVQKLRDMLSMRLGPESDLRDNILSDSLFLFIPTGTWEHPVWDVWPVADANNFQVNQEMMRLDKSLETYLNAEEENDRDIADAALKLHESQVSGSPLFTSDDVELVGSTTNGRAIHSATFRPYGFGLIAPTAVPPILVTGKVDFGIDVITSLTDVNSETFTYLTHRAQQEVITPIELHPTQWHVQSARHRDDRTQEADKRALRAAQELANTVSSILTRILPDFPVSSILVPATPSRFARPEISWRFGRQGAPIESLSSAEQRWVKLAISMAIHRHSLAGTRTPPQERNSLLILDEPEKGLHRAAEAEMVRGLSHLSADLNGSIVLASHSPHALDIPGARTFEVRKEAVPSGRSTIMEVDWRTRDSLTGLGLSTHDLLLWPRVFLAVEGEHDDELIDAWIGDRLRAARVRTLPLHGGKRLSSTLDSQVLFDFTDAHLVAVLDNVQADHLRRTWEGAKALAASGRVVEAKQMIVTQLPDNPRSRGQEHSYLRPWLTKSIDRALTDRVTPYGFTAVDIIRYLPVERIVPNASSWADLDKAHQSELDAAGSQKGIPKDFKRWLKAKHNVDFTPALIRRAAADSPIPKEFELLAKTLEALSSSVAARR